MNFWQGVSIIWAIVIIIWMKHIFSIKPPYVVPRSLIHKPYSFFYQSLSFLFLIICVLISFNLHYKWENQLVDEKSIPIQILFDVSLSMSADDIKPTRFQAAKQAVLELVNSLSGYKISIITYSGIPFIYAPWSTHNLSLEASIWAMEMKNFPPTLDFVGTALWDALLLWAQNIKTIQTGWLTSWAIILLTDWDSNKGFNPEQTVSLLKKYGLSLRILGIGDSNYLIWKDFSWLPVKTTINNDLLERVAKATQWTFWAVDNQQDFQTIFNQIKQQIKDGEKQHLIATFEPLNIILIPLGVINLIFLLAIFIAWARKTYH